MSSDRTSFADATRHITGERPAEINLRGNDGIQVTTVKQSGLRTIFDSWYHDVYTPADKPEERFLDDHHLSLFIEGSARSTPVDSLKNALVENPAWLHAYQDYWDIIEKPQPEFSTEALSAFIRYFGLDKIQQPDGGSGFTLHSAATIAGGDGEDKTTPVTITPEIMEGLLNGSYKAGPYLKRHLRNMLEKYAEELSLPYNPLSILPAATEADITRKDIAVIDITKDAMPIKNLVTDALWQMRIARGLGANDTNNIVHTSVTHHERARNGLAKRSYTLHKLLTTYGRTDIYENHAFMQAAMGIDRTTRPFGYELRRHRYKCGLTSKAAAAAAGIREDSLSKYEMEKCAAPPDALERVCNVLGWDYTEAQALSNQYFSVKFPKIKGAHSTNGHFDADLRKAMMEENLSVETISQQTGIEFGRLHAIIYEKDRNIDCSEIATLCRYFHWDVGTVIDQYFEHKPIERDIKIDPQEKPFSYEMRKHRYQMGLSIEDCAQLLEITASTLRQLELGTRRAPGGFPLVTKLANLLNWDTGEATELYREHIDEKTRPIPKVAWARAEQAETPQGPVTLLDSPFKDPRDKEKPRLTPLSVKYVSAVARGKSNGEGGLPKK